MSTQAQPIPNPANATFGAAWQECEGVAADLITDDFFALAETMTDTPGTIENVEISGEAEAPADQPGKIPNGGDLSLNLRPEHHTKFLAQALGFSTTTTPTGGVFRHLLARHQSDEQDNRRRLTVEINRDNQRIERSVDQMVNVLSMELANDSLLTSTVTFVGTRADQWDRTVRRGPAVPAEASTAQVRGVDAFAPRQLATPLGDLQIRLDDVSDPKAIVVSAKRGTTRVLTGTATVSAGTDALAGVGTLFLTEVRIGDFLLIDTEEVQVLTVTDDLNLVLAANHGAGAAAVPLVAVFGPVVAARQSTLRQGFIKNVPQWDDLKDAERGGSLSENMAQGLEIQMHLDASALTTTTETLTGTIDQTTATKVVTGTGTLFLSEIKPGQRVTIDGEVAYIDTIADDTNAVAVFDRVAADSVGGVWTSDIYWDVLQSRPGRVQVFPTTPLFNEVFARVNIDGEEIKVSNVVLTRTIPTEPDASIGGRFHASVIQQGFATTELTFSRRQRDATLIDRIKAGAQFRFEIVLRTGVDIVDGFPYEMVITCGTCRFTSAPGTVTDASTLTDDVTATCARDASNILFPSAMQIELQDTVADISL